MQRKQQDTNESKKHFFALSHTDWIERNCKHNCTDTNSSND